MTDNEKRAHDLTLLYMQMNKKSDSSIQNFASLYGEILYEMQKRFPEKK